MLQQGLQRVRGGRNSGSVLRLNALLVRRCTRVCRKPLLYVCMCVCVCVCAIIRLPFVLYYAHARVYVRMFPAFGHKFQFQIICLIVFNCGQHRKEDTNKQKNMKNIKRMHSEANNVHIWRKVLGVLFKNVQCSITYLEFLRVSIAYFLKIIELVSSCKRVKHGFLR